MVLLLIVAGLGVWFGRKLLPTQEGMIHQRLLNLLATASVRPNESNLARLAAANRIAGFFTPDADIQLENLGRDVPLIHGRAELAQVAIAAETRLRVAEFAMSDFQAHVDPDKHSATAYVFIMGRMDAQTNRFARPFRLSLVRTNGQWLISSLVATPGLD